MSSPSPSLSPTSSDQGNSDDDDDDEAEFGVNLIIISVVVVVVLLAIATYVATRPQPSALKTGDVVIWKEKQMQGEIIMFDMSKVKFEVRLYNGRTEYLKGEQLCRPGEDGDEESGNVELPRQIKKGKSSSDGGKLKRDGDRSLSRSRNLKSSADSASRSRSKSQPKTSNKKVEAQSKKEHKGHFRKDGTWDPGNGTRHDRHESHLHSILDAKDVHGELAEALGTSVAREKQKREVEVVGVEPIGAPPKERRSSAGDTHRLSVEKRRSAMGNSLSQHSSHDLSAGSGSRSRGSSIGSGSRSRGSSGDKPASVSRESSRSSMKSDDVDDSAQMKRVSSRSSGLKQAAKSTSRSNSASRDRSTSNGRRGSGGGSRARESRSRSTSNERARGSSRGSSSRDRGRKHQEGTMLPDNKHEKMLSVIFSGEEEPEESLKGDGVAL